MKLLLTALILAALAQAGTVYTDGEDNTTPVEVNDLTGFNTYGDMMDGMKVTGFFTGDITISCFWADTGAESGGCTASGSGRGFSLAMDGHTFSSTWFLTGITGGNLLTLTLEGLPGFTVFDRSSPSPGTDGSNAGNDAEGETDDGDVDGEVTYFDPVATLTNSAVGDIYARVIFRFIDEDNGDLIGLPVDEDAQFVLDTDNIGLRDGEPGSGVPEPGTLGLMGAALAGLTLFARRRS